MPVSFLMPLAAPALVGEALAPLEEPPAAPLAAGAEGPVGLKVCPTAGIDGLPLIAHPLAPAVDVGQAGVLMPLREEV